MLSLGRKIHKQALNAQERGEFLKALQLEEKAMVAYQEAEDALGLSEIQAMRFLTLRHLYKKTGHKNYLILAKHAVEASVELAEESGSKEALAIPLFNLAKLLDEMGNLEGAIMAFRKAVENILNNPPKTHDRETVKHDFQIHLAVAEYRLGDKSALERAEGLTEELEKMEETPDYEKHVWVTVAHMKIADMLKEDDPKKAKEHLKKAKKMIDSDSRLKLVSEQWKKLSEVLLKGGSLAAVIAFPYVASLSLQTSLWH